MCGSFQRHVEPLLFLVIFHIATGSAEQNTLVADLLMEMYAFTLFQRGDNMCYLPVYIAGLYDSYDKDRCSPLMDCL